MRAFSTVSGRIRDLVRRAVPRDARARSTLRLARGALRRGGGRLGRVAQPVLAEVGGVREAGGLAADDPDAGAALAAGHELLDLGVVEPRRRDPPVLGEHLREVATAREGRVQRALQHCFVDHGDFPSTLNADGIPACEGCLS